MRKRTRDSLSLMFNRLACISLISTTDERGKMLPAGNDLVKETIGRGENGLRVEVSLKYRRLLVQKLAKESLLSAKDHDVFRLDGIDGSLHKMILFGVNGSQRVVSVLTSARNCLTLPTRM